MRSPVCAIVIRANGLNSLECVFHPTADIIVITKDTAPPSGQVRQGRC
ncbi:hypothetical protein HMPREF1868_01001 [Olsenella sp. DNF00959]|nr:hypothetical protein HMPREF1868_01001 [Olsenella sp. DNF00959]